MEIKFFLVGLLLFGIYFTVFGLRLLFQHGFVENLRNGIWKPGEKDKELFPGNSGYNYDRYGRGIKYTLIGLMSLGVSVYGLFFN